MTLTNATLFVYFHFRCQLDWCPVSGKIHHPLNMLVAPIVVSQRVVVPPIIKQLVILVSSNFLRFSTNNNKKVKENPFFMSFRHWSASFHTIKTKNSRDTLNEMFGSKLKHQTSIIINLSNFFISTSPFR